MFPLHTSEFPGNTNELKLALEESLCRVFELRGDAVSIRENKYPALEEMRITLDRAQVRAPLPGPPVPTGATAPGMDVARFELSGREISVSGARLDLSLNARDLQLHQGREDNGNLILLLHTAAEGKIEIVISKQDLEILLGDLARDEARKRGVAIDGVELTIESQGARSLVATVKFRARKAFLSARIKIRGRLDIDDELTAKLSGLACEGDGAIGSLACGVLDPFLRRANNRQFPLMALPLGEVQLRDVQIAGGDHISVHARFGSAGAA